MYITQNHPTVFLICFDVSQVGSSCLPEEIENSLDIVFGMESDCWG